MAQFRETPRDLTAAMARQIPNSSADARTKTGPKVDPADEFVLPDIGGDSRRMQGKFLMIVGVGIALYVAWQGLQSTFADAGIATGGLFSGLLLFAGLLLLVETRQVCVQRLQLGRARVVVRHGWFGCTHERITHVDPTAVRVVLDAADDPEETDRHADSIVLDDRLGQHALQRFGSSLASARVVAHELAKFLGVDCHEEQRTGKRKHSRLRGDSDHIHMYSHLELENDSCDHGCSDTSDDD